jgi:heme oxygenase (biliverdin-IX-beta and delta-forming)
MEVQTSPVGGAMARLRAETGMLQGRVERDLALFGDAASWLDYRLYLCRMYGFLAPTERALGEAMELTGVIPDADQRNTKIALLARDLAALGVERGQLVQIPKISAPLLDELPAALGWMYAVEASTLEGEVLARHLAPRLSSELDCASAYLRCYGDEVLVRWRDFGAAMDAYVDRADAGVCDHIVLAATECLIRLHRWLASSWASQCAGRLHA